MSESRTDFLHNHNYGKRIEEVGGWFTVRKLKAKYHLAYLVNRFMNPIEKGFFQQYDVKVDEDTWALSELIQWVWRSSIRDLDGKPIVIYIPSKRMRDLFKQYLTSDKFEALPEEAVTNQLPSDWNL